MRKPSQQEVRQRLNRYRQSTESYRAQTAAGQPVGRSIRPPEQGLQDVAKQTAEQTGDPVEIQDSQGKGHSVVHPDGSVEYDDRIVGSDGRVAQKKNKKG